MYLISENMVNYKIYSNILEYIPSDNLLISSKKLSNSKLVTAINLFCYNQAKNKFIVSLSGGVDSMVLIFIIKSLGYTVIGAHLNYNNRIETTIEEQFLIDFCMYNDIKLHIERVSHVKRGEIKRDNYEKITKDIRLNFYKSVMEIEKSDSILLAHHKDDIIENIFANLSRGRNILDLAVIREKTIINNITVYRPMIQFYKSSIYKFADEYQVPYFKDTTPDWSVRGKYRNQILPELETTFSNVKQNLLNINNQSSDWSNIIHKKIIEPFLDNITISNNNILIFSVHEYLDYPVTFWQTIFMFIFHKYSKKCPSHKSIENFIFIINNKNNCKITLSIDTDTYLQNYIIKILFLNI
tara:strand:+ start:10704 stop:11768 length:1065 start_codon:yes stop_codon:yes gene_type:complete